MRRRKPLFSLGFLMAVALTIIPVFLAAQDDDPFAQPVAPAAAAPSPTPLDNLLAAPLPADSIPAVDPNAALAPAVPAANVEDLASQEALARQRQVKDLQEQIRTLFSESQFEAAIDKCEELLRIEPLNATALLMRERAQRYLVSSSIPPTPVAPAEVLATPVPAMVDPGAPIAPQDPSLPSTSPTSETPTVATPVVAPPAAEVPLKSAFSISPLILIVAAVVVIALIAGGVVFFMKRRGLVVPEIPKAAAGGGSAYLGAVTQPGYFEFDGAAGASQMPTKPAPFYDQKTMIEGGRDLASEPTPLPVSGQFSPLESEEEAPAAPEPIDFTAKTRAIPVADIKAAQAAMEQGPGPSASSVDINLSSIMIDAPAVEPPAEALSPPPPSAPEFSIADPAHPAPPKAPAPLKPKAPQAPSVPLDIASMAAPEGISAGAPSAPNPISGDRATPPVAFDIAAPSLFEARPAAEQTASSNPDALSYNSLMFGNDATQDNVSRDVPVPSADDLTLNTFNKEYSSLMFGNPGADETKMPPGMGSGEPGKEAVAAEVPSAPAGISLHESPSDQLVIHDEDGVNSSDATAIGGMDRIPDTEQTAVLTPPGAPKISMFDRQRAAGAAALASGDLPKAVHCLSIAASLKPADKEVREMLEEARAKRAAAK